MRAQNCSLQRKGELGDTGQNKVIEAEAVLARIFPDDQVGAEKRAVKALVFRRGLKDRITVQIAQHFVGISHSSKSTTLALSLITSGLNVIGSLVTMTAVDRTGWRKLMIICMLGTITCHITYGLIYRSTATALKISYHESTHFGANSACHAYLATSNSGSSSCMTCYYDMIVANCHIALTNRIRSNRYSTSFLGL
ncbi:Inositol transporter 4 [Bienertia sinuspersici]